WGLFNVAQHHPGHTYHTGLSTYSLLVAGYESGQLTREAFRTAIVRLLAWQHILLPIDATLIYEELVERGFEVDASIRLMVCNATDPSYSPEAAIKTVMEVVRKVALSSVGKGALATITSIAVEQLMVERHPILIAQLFLREAQQTLHLLPREYAIVKERTEAVLIAKIAEQRHPLMFIHK
ncbi:MAG: hypothetical protein M3Z05_19820, partial [Gemmatimonadota bacterium]|nr:hypothetical protein [Gemmatimonadota bacterium]